MHVDVATVGKYLRFVIVQYWLKVLRRRSQKDRTSRRRLASLANRWLVEPRICHPKSERALARHYLRQEPGAVVPHAGICTGGPGQPGSLPRLPRHPPTKAPHPPADNQPVSGPPFGAAFA